MSSATAETLSTMSTSHGSSVAQRTKRSKAVKRAACPEINSRIIKAAETESVDALLNVIDSYLSQMNLVNLTTALHRLAKLAGGTPTSQDDAFTYTLHQVLHQIQSVLSRFDGFATSARCQTLSNIVWSLASLQHVDLPLVSTVVQLCQKHFDTFKPFELSSVLWALARLSCLSEAARDLTEELFERSVDPIAAGLEHFNFRFLSMTAWAYAAAGLPDHRIFGPLVPSLISTLRNSTCFPDQVANVAWAISVAGIKDDILTRELAKRALKQLPDYDPQEFVDVSVALASCGNVGLDFFGALAHLGATSPLDPRHLASVLWALSRVEPMTPVLSSAVVRLLPQCSDRIDVFDVDDLASIMISLAKCYGQGHHSRLHGLHSGIQAAVPQEIEDFVHACQPRIFNEMPNLSGDQLSVFTAALMSVGSPSCLAMLEPIGEEVRRREHKFETGALLLLVRDLPWAKGGVCDPAVPGLFRAIVQRFDTLNAAELQVVLDVCSDLCSGGQDSLAPCDAYANCMLLGNTTLDQLQLLRSISLDQFVGQDLNQDTRTPFKYGPTRDHSGSDQDIADARRDNQGAVLSDEGHPPAPPMPVEPRNNLYAYPPNNFSQFPTTGGQSRSYGGAWVGAPNA